MRRLEEKKAAGSKKARRFMKSRQGLLTRLPRSLLRAEKPVRMMGWSERWMQRRPRRAR